MANDDTTPTDPGTRRDAAQSKSTLPNRLPIVDADDDDPRVGAVLEMTRVQRFRRQLPWAVATLFCYWFALGVVTHIPLQPAKTIEHGDKLVHAAAYGGLAFCLFVVLAMFRRIRASSYGIVWGVVAVYGIVDELLQGFVPHRQPDLKDWIADLIGATAALIVAYLLHGWWTRLRAARPICQADDGR